MRTILSILLSLPFLSALGQGDQITYADKDKNLPNTDVRKLFRDVDANEVKHVVNANATATVAALLGKQAALVSGVNIRTVQGFSLLSSGDINLIDDAIVDGQPNSPTQNAVFDALALKANLTGFVFNEVPSGTINGSNVTFTITNTPTTGTFVLYIDGLAMTPTVDYSRSGTTITCVIPPSSAILCHYLH